VTQREKELATALIAANRAPANAYTGGDRAAIESAVRSAWKARYPNLQVLEVRMPESWSRETGWRWDSTSKAFRRFDESSMRVSTVLATSPTVATWQTQWVHTFHLSGNKLVVQPFKYDEPSPRHQLLRSNL
ncbi:MAG: hypothetical protein KC910_34760, partial [Candidatus Eremiobacteraeota bacterium]|nr:hypothetical protein [Candidatus Eremiobacteraeota bacterium]